MIRAALMVLASLLLPAAAMATLCLHGSEGHVELLGLCHDADDAPSTPETGLGSAGLQHEPHPGTAFETAGSILLLTPQAAEAPGPSPRPDAASPVQGFPDRAGRARDRGTDLLAPVLRL